MEISTSSAFPVALHKKSCTLGIHYRPLFKNKRDVEIFKLLVIAKSSKNNRFSNNLK